MAGYISLGERIMKTADEKQSAYTQVRYLTFVRKMPPFVNKWFVALGLLLAVTTARAFCMSGVEVNAPVSLPFNARPELSGRQQERSKEQKDKETERRYDLARNLYNQKKYDEAETEFREVLIRRPD